MGWRWQGQTGLLGEVQELEQRPTLLLASFFSWAAEATCFGGQGRSVSVAREERAWGEVRRRTTWNPACVSWIWVQRLVWKAVEAGVQALLGSGIEG